MARVVRENGTGKFLIMDEGTGKWNPATRADLEVFTAGPVSGAVLAGSEGFLGAASILESMDLLREGTAEAAERQFPATAEGAELLGDLTLVAGGLSVGKALLGGAMNMLRGAGQLGRPGKAGRRIKEIGRAADEGPINVPRDFGEFTPGQPQGPIRAAVGGTMAILQGVVNQSKILTRAFGTRNPSVGRQVAGNVAAVRGTALKPVDFGKAARLPRQKLATAVEKTGEKFAEALPAQFKNEKLLVSSLQQKALLDAIKTAPKAERQLLKNILPKKEVEQGFMTAEQVLQRHRDLRRLATKTDNLLVREAIDKATAELEGLMELSKGINVDILNVAKEQWRFDQALINSLGKGGQVNFDTWIGQLKKFFPREFQIGDVGGKSARGIKLSEKGQDAINTAIDIADAGGVSLPSKDVSAVDWIIVLGTLFGGGTAGTF